jgi:hypothetical protein
VVQPPDSSIEDALARLMPKAISEGGQRALDEMLDELHGEEIPLVTADRRIKGGWQILVSAGIAASIALLVTFRLETKVSEPFIPLASMALGPNLVLVSESDRIEKMSDEGWMADPQGGMMQAVRMRVVGENSLRDEETGIVVQISEPRDELLLIPVNEF